MLLQKSQKLLFIGDSITDAGRAQPIGEGRDDAYGRGFVALVEALLGSTYPERAIRIQNLGISGNTVRDLAARWQRDVLDLKPDWLAVMIGINDVWRQFDLPKMPERAVWPEEYETTLDGLLARTRPLLKGLVLMTPYYIEPNPQDALRRQMDRYGQIVKKLGQRHDAVVVDMQAAFDRLLAHLYPSALGWDRVHPNPTGHMVIARAFLQAVGYKWGGEAQAEPGV